MREETSAQMVSAKINRNMSTYKDKQSLQSIDHQKPVKYKI